MEKENEEEKEIKTRFVDFWTYCVVFAAGWGYLGPLVISGVFIVSQGALMASDYWLFKWASKEEEHTREQDSELIDIFDQRDHYFEVYISKLRSSILWLFLSCFSSSKLHMDRLVGPTLVSPASMVHSECQASLRVSVR